MNMPIELFTERLKLKDIIIELEESEQKEYKKAVKNIKELIQNISKEYNIKEEDIEYIRKKNPLKAEDIKIEDGERAAIRYINTADLDRDNEIVLPEGADIRDFQKSMTVLYAHDYRGLPIGRDLWIKLIEGKGWLAKTVYASHQKAEDIYNLVKDHFLNTSSIGFIPLAAVSPNEKGWDKVKGILMEKYGIREKLIDGARRIYTKWILLEHSDVPVPSNINALNIAVGKGFIKDEGILKDIQEGIEIVEEEEETELIENKNAMEDDGIEIIEDNKEEEEIIKIEDVEKPLPNEHGCRLKDPKLFQPDSFRRVKRDSDGKEYSIIMGKLKGETTMTEQSYRYNKDIWSVAQARKHCKDHKGILFEPAAEGKQVYNCECIKCGNKITSDKHCDTFKCPKCGGDMRRVERPGPGKEEATITIKAEVGDMGIPELGNKEGILDTTNEKIPIEVNLTGMKELVAIIIENTELKKRIAELEAEIETNKKEEMEIEEPEEKELDLEIEPKIDDDKIELNPEEIKDIIMSVIKKESGNITESLKEEIGNSFKRATGKIM